MTERESVGRERQTEGDETVMEEGRARGRDRQGRGAWVSGVGRY